MRRDPNCCKKSKKSQRLRGDQTAEALLLLMLPFGLCLQAEKEGEFGRRMGNICSILSNSRCRTQFSDSWQTKQHREGAVGGGSGNTVQSTCQAPGSPGYCLNGWLGWTKSVIRASVWPFLVVCNEHPTPILTGYPGLSFLNLTDERSSLFLWFWYSVLEKPISEEYKRYLDISMVTLYHSFSYLLSQVPPQNPICPSVLQIASCGLAPLYMVSGLWGPVSGPVFWVERSSSLS